MNSTDFGDPPNFLFCNGLMAPEWRVSATDLPQLLYSHNRKGWKRALIRFAIFLEIWTIKRKRVHLVCADPITLCTFCEISALIAELNSQSRDRMRPKISRLSSSEQEPHPEPFIITEALSGGTWSVQVQVTEALVDLTCRKLSVSAPFAQQLLHSFCDLPVKCRPLSKLVWAVLHQKKDMSFEPRL